MKWKIFPCCASFSVWCWSRKQAEESSGCDLRWCFSANSSDWTPSSASLWLGLVYFLLVWASVFVARYITWRVQDVHAASLALSTACLVETLLVWAGELGGVSKARHCGRSHSSLWTEQRVRGLRFHLNNQLIGCYRSIAIKVSNMFIRSFPHAKVLQTDILLLKNNTWLF